MTKDQAREIVYAHEIDEIIYNEEECELLQKHNIALYEAYEALLELAEICESPFSGIVERD